MNSILRSKLSKAHLRKERVHLIGVKYRLDSGVGEEVDEERDGPVREPDMLDQSFVNQRLHLRPY
jgi:hypothetical protein